MPSGGTKGRTTTCGRDEDSRRWGVVWERFMGRGRGEAGRRWVCSPRPPTPLGGLRSYTHQMADRLIEWMNQSPEIVMPICRKRQKKRI